MIEFNEANEVVRKKSHQVKSPQQSIHLFTLVQPIEDQDLNIWAGGLFANNSGTFPFVAKLTQGLQVQFYKEFQYSDGSINIRSLAELGNSIILTGQAFSNSVGQTLVTILSISKQGEIEWGKAYQHANITGFTSAKIIDTKDDQIVVGGFYFSNAVFVMKTNTSGDFIWSTTFQTLPNGDRQFSGEVLDVDIFQDNKVLATGYYKNLTDSKTNGFLVKMDENGQNTEGPLPTIPFDGFSVINTTQHLSLNPFSPIVQELEVTHNEPFRPYGVSALDFVNNTQTYQYTIEEEDSDPEQPQPQQPQPQQPQPQTQLIEVKSDDGFQIPFYISIGVGSLCVIILLLLLVCCVIRLKKKRSNQQHRHAQVRANAQSSRAEQNGGTLVKERDIELYLND